jgi:hypothetical protein
MIQFKNRGDEKWKSKIFIECKHDVEVEIEVENENERTRIPMENFMPKQLLLNVK